MNCKHSVYLMVYPRGVYKSPTIVSVELVVCCPYGALDLEVAHRLVKRIADLCYVCNCIY